MVELKIPNVKDGKFIIRAIIQIQNITIINKLQLSMIGRTVSSVNIVIKKTP